MARRRVARAGLAGLLCLTLAGPAAAQDLTGEETAALRARLERLSAEIADLRARLGQGPSAPQAGIGGRVMVRLDRIEVELSRLTGQIEELAHRQRRMAEDGARRIGGLDLRVTELEGGDIAALAPQPPLGADPRAPQAADPPDAADGTGAPGAGRAGDAPAGSEAGDQPGPAPDQPAAGAGTGPAAGPPPPPGSQDPMLALAVDDIRQGRFDQGEARLEQVLAAAPDAPEAQRAHFWLGKSHFTRGEHAAAARSFLNAYNSAQTGPRAPEALLQLGITLGRLGQTREACLTLREVRTRFGDRDAGVLDAADAEADALACGS